MDPQRFDRLAREFGNPTDRRRALRSVAGGALATLGIGLAARQARAASGQDGNPCTTSSDCETGLVCEGASSGLLGGLVGNGTYGPPFASTIFGPSSGTCRYRSDNCGKSGQYCDRNSDCCNGLNLECRGHECQRRT